MILHTSSRIDTVDPQTATIILEDGRQYSGDVVVGADGVHSRARQAIGPNVPPAFKTHHSAFRFMVERQKVLDDPETNHFAMVRHSMDMWYGPDRKIVLYPTANNTLLNFVLVHPSNFSEASDDYNQTASKDMMFSVYKSFEPSILKLLNKADPETLKVYPLFDLPTLDTFINQRLVLIGDAAHPFTPHLAQGGAQAIEDGVSVAVMLSPGVTREEVPTRLELYMRARYERATTIQNYSRIVGGDGEADGDKGPSRFKGTPGLTSVFSKADKYSSS